MTALVLLVACSFSERSADYMMDVSAESEAANEPAVALRGGLVAKLAMAPEADEAPPPPGAPPGAPPADPQDQGPSTTRSWFPEAFLWQPLVETNEQGIATLDVRVPDQLTTWRVLALAHDRGGQQAGTVHQFDTRLPLYVDPVVPGWLVAGDRLALPVQAVNRTSSALNATIEVTATGAMNGQGAAALELTAGSSDVRVIPLEVAGAGEAVITARVAAPGHEDAAERKIPIQPAGRPVVRSQGSSLASERTFRLAAPPQADPVTETLTVEVFPGPQAVVQAEVERLLQGATPVDGAYGLTVVAHLRDLAVATGLETKEADLRRLRLLSWQRLVQRTRLPTAGQAADLLVALGDGDPALSSLLEEVRPRLLRALLSGQRADGTWSHLKQSTLQRVMVETAVAAMALPEQERGARLRAMGAVERYLGEVKDAYTASVILAAKLAEGQAATQLRAIINEALSSNEEGTTVWAWAEPGTTNPWGRAPSPSEELAWAILALEHNLEARSDLASQLMGKWSSIYGFGAGPADSIALKAIVSALPTTPRPVEITLEMQGRQVAKGVLDPAQPRQALTLWTEPAGADAPFSLRADPQVPGLAFVATRRSWVPWPRRSPLRGVDLEVAAPDLVRGQVGVLHITAAAPSGSALVIEQHLPAGTQVESNAANAVLAGAQVETFPNQVRVVTPTFSAGEVLELELPVIPAFAGQFQTGPLRVAVDGAPPVDLRPMVWTVADAQ